MKKVSVSIYIQIRAASFFPSIDILFEYVQAKYPTPANAYMASEMHIYSKFGVLELICLTMSYIENPITAMKIS